MEILRKGELNSSNLKSATYYRDATNPLEYVLTVTFLDGACYSYYGVDAEAAAGLFEAQSPGSYLAARIAKAYQYAPVEGEPDGEAAVPQPSRSDSAQVLIEHAKAAVDKLPQCRAKALVLTKLDEAQLWMTRVG